MPGRGPWRAYQRISGATEYLAGLSQVPQLIMLYLADMPDRMILIYTGLLAISKLSQIPHDFAL